jgi:hypothetical protein
MDALVFQNAPEVSVASNTFIRVPIVLQYDDTPLIEVVREQQAGYSTSIPIYHSDGTYLAKVVGSRLFATPAGEKAGVVLRHPQDATICELGGKTVFELRRTGAAALKENAELFTPDGTFVRCPTELLPTIVTGEQEKALQIRGLTMTNTTISGFRIGILIRSDGGLLIGVNVPPPPTA